MSQDTPQLTIVPQGRQRHKPLSREEREKRINTLRFILDAGSYQARAKIQEVANRLVFTGNKRHAPSGDLLRTLLHLHKLDGTGGGFLYKDKFNADGQLITSRPKLIAACRRTPCYSDMTDRQLRHALAVLENEGIIRRAKGPLSPGKWALYLWIMTDRLADLIEHPEKVGNQQKLAMINAKARAENRGGRMAQKGQHTLLGVWGVASSGPVPLAAVAANGTQCLPLATSPHACPLKEESASPTPLCKKELPAREAPGPSAGEAAGPSAPASPRPLPREYEPAVVKVIEMAETREIFCNAERTRMARKLTQEERDALARCVRTMGLTPAWLERYHGAIHNDPAHYVIENAEEAWWLKVEPVFFVKNFWMIRQELEKAQVQGALELRSYSGIPITDNVGWQQMVRAQLENLLSFCADSMNDPAHITQVFADETLWHLSAAIRVVAARAVPELEAACPGLIDQVMTRWAVLAKREMLEDPRTLLALAEAFPIVEWLGLPSAAVLRAQEWLDKEIQRWNCEGADLQRRLNKCQK